MYGKFIVNAWLAAFMIVFSQGVNATQPLTLFDDFLNLYTSRFADAMPCPIDAEGNLAVCSSSLRNTGNAPRILQHNAAPNKIAILVHGLSDSPFYLSDIAKQFHRQGYTVILPLLPGHGQREADQDMEDASLGLKWTSHVSDIVTLARAYDVPIVLGGFSTGGALAVQHYLADADSIQGIALFSAALALSDNAETLSRIWGIKWVAKLLDGDYSTDNTNPFKYPQVSSYAALQLMDIINEIRQSMAQGQRIQVPLFVAHSQADTTTPFSGVEHLIDMSENTTMAMLFSEEEAICHADVVVSQDMYSHLKNTKGWVVSPKRCASSQPNPRFQEMIQLLSSFVSTQLSD